MFPRFSDLLNYFLGTTFDFPVQTYGFFLAMGFLIAAMIMRSELKRKENEGLMHPFTKKVLKNKPAGSAEIIGGALLSAAIGYKLFGIVLDYVTFQQDPQKYLLSSKGSIAAALIILLVSLGHCLYRNNLLKKKGIIETEEIIHPYQHTWSILIVAILSAIVGSKLFDIIDNFGSFLRDPFGSIFSFQGLTFYGGLIVTVIVLLLYMKVIKMDWKFVIDATAPAIMLGYAIGRLGCHLSGDGCWGIVNELAKPEWLTWLPDWAWASHYPHNVIKEGIPIPGCAGTNCTMLENPVWPTSLYESTVSFLFFLVLWFSRKKMRAPVTLFPLFLILNGIERFFIEKIRVNHRFSFLGMNPTQAEIISTCLVITGIIVILYFTYQSKKTIKPPLHDRT